MADLARKGLQSIKVRTKALEVTRGLLQKDYEAEACACLNYVRDHVRYVRDIRGIETVHDPDTLLSLMAGDCDDKSILLASLLESIGHRTRFVAISYAPGVFSHVWVQDYIRGKWLDLEPTEPIQCGKRVPRGVSEIYQEV